MLSYRRESGNNELNNLVLLYARDNAVPLDDAVDAVVSTIHDRAWDLLACKAEISKWLHENYVEDDTVGRVHRWMNSVEALVSGSLTFQLISDRWQEV